MKWSGVGIHGINQAISAVPNLWDENENIEFFECFDKGQMNFACENKIVNVKTTNYLKKSHVRVFDKHYY